MECGSEGMECGVRRWSVKVRDGVTGGAMCRVWRMGV